MNEDSRSKRMLMAALNKQTIDTFTERRVKNTFPRKQNEDLDYIPNLQSGSDSDESQGKPCLYTYTKNSESVNDFGILNASMEGSVLTELQPLQPYAPEELGSFDAPNDKDSEDRHASNNEGNEVMNVQIEDTQSYTKKGTVRKRKKYVESVEERKKKLFNATVQKHSLKAPCNMNCLHKCRTKISEERRFFLNTEYWKVEDSRARKNFMLHHVSTVPVKQRTVSGVLDSFRRTNSFRYSLKNDSGESQHVCKKFFLSTLGYTHDRVLRTSLSSSTNSVVVKKDKRCTTEPHNKINDEPIRKHINSFQPTISHYRREHAPNRLYLASDLSFVKMHEDFIARYGNVCSYEKYRTVANKMNISIVKLGHEQCESCEEFNMHSNIHNKENLDDSCEVCNKWGKHIEKAKNSRDVYITDKEKDEDLSSVIYCADMEKVIMLPRLDMFKSAVFTHRIVAYNESFVPVGKKQKHSKPFAAVWHEVLFGRTKDELISTFYQFVLTKRDTKRITLWLDNCTAQNKNWSLFSFFLYIINSDEIASDEIIVRYFEPGHTFMAADSFHHRVEQSMQRMGNKLYDFEDFVTAVKNATPNTEVLAMDLKHFFAWTDCSSQYKLSRTNPRPYLHDMVEVIFTRGLKYCKYRNDFLNDTYTELNFLSATFTKKDVLPKPQKKEKFVGISTDKKGNILKNLGGLFEKNRLKFWETLPE